MNQESTNSSKPFAVYVAASAAPADVPRVNAAISALKADGFLVTCTWPGIIATVGDANPRDASHAERRGWSTQDLEEVSASDAVWFLVPLPPATTRGGWYEAGYADSEKKHLVFSGDTLQSVFCARGIEFSTDAAALTYLRSLRDRDHALKAGLRELADANAMDLRVKAALTGVEG